MARKQQQIISNSLDALEQAKQGNELSSMEDLEAQLSTLEQPVQQTEPENIPEPVKPVVVEVKRPPKVTVVKPFQFSARGTLIQLRPPKVLGDEFVVQHLETIQRDFSDCVQIGTW